MPVVQRAERKLQAAALSEGSPSTGTIGSEKGWA
jgi:hypothetical protein